MASWIRILLPLMLVGCATMDRAGPSSIQSPSHAIEMEVDRIAQRAVEEVPLEALSIVVLRGDEMLVARGYGAQGVSADTSYRIGSITKLITALGIAKLVDSDRLRFEDHLDAFIPAALPRPDVSIADMLNHTAGLASHERAAVARWRESSLPITDEFVWEHVRNEPRTGAPGTSWSYSSSGFHILGMVIEKLTGRKYSAYVERKIAAPLGLASIRLCSGQPRGASQRPDYIALQGELQEDPNWELPGIGAAGGLCASAIDVVRLVHAVARGGVVKPATLARMTSATALGGGVEAGYGLGARLGVLDGHAKWGHSGGGVVSNRSVVAHYPAQELTIAVLTNTEREDTRMSAMDIEELVAREVLRLPSHQSHNLSLPDASRYAGTYLAPGRRTRIALDGDGLVFSTPGSADAPMPMAYLGADEFLPDPAYPGYRFVFQIVGDRAVALSTRDNGWFSGVRVREAERR